jgi:hypothetical protein
MVSRVKIIGFMALMVMLSLAGCGGNDGSSASGRQTSGSDASSVKGFRIGQDFEEAKAQATEDFADYISWTEDTTEVFDDGDGEQQWRRRRFVENEGDAYRIWVGSTFRTRRKEYPAGDGWTWIKPYDFDEENGEWRWEEWPEWSEESTSTDPKFVLRADDAGAVRYIQFQGTLVNELWGADRMDLNEFAAAFSEGYDVPLEWTNDQGYWFYTGIREPDTRIQISGTKGNHRGIFWVQMFQEEQKSFN